MAEETIRPLSRSEERSPMLIGAGRTQLVVIAAKAGIGLGALALLVWLARPSEIMRRLATADGATICIGLCVVALTVPLAALRWSVVARAVGTTLSWKAALQLTWIGIFFGQLLPATVGGDVVRGLLAFRQGHPLYSITTSIVLDRVAALLAALLLIIIGLPVLAGFARPHMVMNVAILAFAMLLGLGVVSIADMLVPPRLLRGTALRAAQKLRDARRYLLGAAGACAVVLSVAIHLMTIGAVELFAHAIGLKLDYLQCLSIVPTALIAAMIPITINGWGVREGVIITGFALFGVAPDQALIPSMLVGLSAMVAGLPGGLLWLTLRWR